MDEARLRRNNYLFILMDGVFFLLAISFLDPNAVIPVFVFTYTNSLRLAGLAATLSMASAIVAQIFMGPYVDGLQNMPAFITRVMFLFRPLPLIMIPVLLGGLPASWTVALFFVLYAMLWASDGLIVVPWGDLLARTIRPAQRGHLLGVQQLLGGVGCLGAGYLIKTILASPALSDPVRFSILFGAAGLLLLTGTVFFAFTRDLPRQARQQRVNPLVYYRQLPRYFMENKDFIKLSAVRVFASVATMVSPLVILFGKTALGLSEAQVSTFIYVQIVGSLVGGALWGIISSRVGNKAVISAVQAASLLVPALALLCLLRPGAAFVPVLLGVSVLANGMIRGGWLGYINYTMDLSSDQNRTVYLLLGSLIPFPLTVLSFLAGIVADRWGFVPLFVLSLAGAAVAAVLSLRLTSFRCERE